MNPKVLRGKVLAIVAAAYPTPVLDSRIRLTLDDLEIGQEAEQLRGILRYLQDQGYVRTERDWSDVEGDIVRVWLEGKGLALIRGDVAADDWIDPRGYESVARMPHIRKRG